MVYNRKDKGNMRKIVTFLFISILTFSCSKKGEKQKTELVFTSAIVGGVSFSGSMALWGKSDDGEEFALTIGNSTEGEVLALTNGNWTFSAIGWEGSNPLEGTPKCAKVDKVLNGGELGVELNLGSLNCNDGHFSDPSYMTANQFNPLKVIGCFGATSFSSGDTCSNSYKSNTSSIKLRLDSEYKETSNTNYNSIYTQCFSEDSATSGEHFTTVNIPMSNSDKFPFKFTIETYSDTTCGSLVDEVMVDAPASLNPHYQITTNGSETEIFLISADQGDAGIPAPSGITLVTTSPGIDSSPTVTLSGLTIGYNITLYSDSSCSTNLTATYPVTTSTEDFTLDTLASDGVYQIYATQDNGTTPSICSSVFATYELDTIVPTVTIDDSPGTTIGTCNFTASATDTNSSGTQYMVTFSEPVDPTSLSPGSISNNGSAAIGSWSTPLSCGDGLTYLIETMSVTTEGTIQPFFPIGAVSDFAGNTSAASTNNTTIVNYDTTSPSVPTITLPVDTNPSYISTPTIRITSTESGVGILYNDPSCISEILRQNLSPMSVDLNPIIPSDGTYNYYAATEDLAGNISSCAGPLTYTLDTIVPNIMGITSNSTATQSKTWTWSADETAEFSFEVTQSSTPVSMSAFGPTTTATQPSGDGTYYLHVIAKDTAGNETGVHTVLAELDNTAPILSPELKHIPRFEEILYTDGSLVKIFWSGFSDSSPLTYEAVVYNGIDCNGGVYGTYPLGTSTSGTIPMNLPNDDYAIKIKAIDEASNLLTSSCSNTYTTVNTGWSSPAWPAASTGMIEDLIRTPGGRILLLPEFNVTNAVVIGGDTANQPSERIEFAVEDTSGASFVTLSHTIESTSMFEIETAYRRGSGNYYSFGGLNWNNNLLNADLYQYTSSVTTVNNYSSPLDPVWNHAMVALEHPSDDIICIWGGDNGVPGVAEVPSDEGACYNATLDTWQTMNLTGAPSPRFGHIASSAKVGTMCIWGGTNDGSTALGDGACYDYNSDSWTPMPGLPEARFDHQVITIPEENKMCIWGGGEPSYDIEDGYCYDFLSNSWSPMAPPPAQLGTKKMTMTWTGARVCIMGGYDSSTSANPITNSACYSPRLDNWIQLPPLLSVSGQIDSLGYFGGDKVCILGGYMTAPNINQQMDITCLPVR